MAATRSAVTLFSNGGGHVPMLVVNIGAEHVGAFGVGAHEMADLVHQHAASQWRPPSDQHGRVQVEPPTAVHREGAEPFGSNRLGRKQGMSEVGGMLHCHQSGRGEQARLVGSECANDNAHAALIRPASVSTPIKARTSCGGRALGGLAMSSVRAHAAATSPLPISAATASGPLPTPTRPEMARP